jgi:O-antigen/teichoic acid export membrane protein
MISLGSFVFLTSVSNIAFIVCDTLFLASMYSFSQAGIYAVAQYFSQVLEVPMRSMQSSSVPLISEYWRTKNMVGLQSIYRKSSINLLLAGMGIGGLILVNVQNIQRYLPDPYSTMILPLVILVAARWINLGTGLNHVIIQLSTLWRFDFATTLIYSLIGIPLNYLLINRMGMLGAALANVAAMFIYNTVRFTFLYKRYGLQPFSVKTLAGLIGGMTIIAFVYWIPSLPNLYLDGLIRSSLFIGLFGLFVLSARLSQEFNAIWTSSVRKFVTRLKS